MKIVVPYTFVHPPTWRAIAWWPFEIEPRTVREERAYLDLLTSRFDCDDPASFIIVEHDVVPLSGQLVELLTCPEEWCSFPTQASVECGWGAVATFSLVRFREGFLRANRKVFEKLKTRRAAGVYQPTWTVLDSWLAKHCDRPPHVHGPPWADNQRPTGPLH